MFDEKFWLAAAFCFFVGLIIKFVWPKISGLLLEKSKNIADEILEAKRLKDSAQNLLSKSEETLALAQSEAKKMIEMARLEADKIAKEAQESLQREIARSSEVAMTRIKTEEEHAIRNLKAQIISQAVDKLLNSLELNGDQHQKVVARAVESLNQKI